jgi:hypothetical protein
MQRWALMADGGPRGEDYGAPSDEHPSSMWLCAEETAKITGVSAHCNGYTAGTKRKLKYAVGGGDRRVSRVPIVRQRGTRPEGGDTPMCNQGFGPSTGQLPPVGEKRRCHRRNRLLIR